MDGGVCVCVVVFSSIFFLLEGHFILLWGIDCFNPPNTLFKPPGGFCQGS